MEATKYTVMNSITGLLLKWWNETSLTANIIIIASYQVSSSTHKNLQAKAYF